MARKRCRYCGKKNVYAGTSCSVCGIAFGAAKNDVTKEERRKAYFCRTIYYLGVWLIIYGGMRLIAGLLNIHDNRSAVAGTAFVLLLGACDVVIGAGLLRYRRWSYWGGIALVLCEAAIMTWYANAIEYAFIWLIAGLCIYYLTNKTSRTILLSSCTARHRP